MPNHITNIVSIKPRYSDEDESDYDEKHAQINDLYKRLKTDESDFDFNAVIPMPDTVERGDLSLERQRELGPENNWYDWSVKHWGTKWNSYEVRYLNRSYDNDTEVYDILVKFETAWSPPVPVLQKLAEDFEVEFTWVDEGDDEWHQWEKVTPNDSSKA